MIRPSETPDLPPPLPPKQPAATAPPHRPSLKSDQLAPPHRASSSPPPPASIAAAEATTAALHASPPLPSFPDTIQPNTTRRASATTAAHRPSLAPLGSTSPVKPDTVRRVSVVVGELAGWQAVQLQANTGDLSAGQVVFLPPPSSGAAGNDEVSLTPPDLKIESDDDSDDDAKAEQATKRPPEPSPPQPLPLPSPSSSSSSTAAPLSPAEIARILALPGNDECVDCGNGRPTWACVRNGVVLCLTCSGLHRGLDPATSLVRSLDLDSWKPELLELMLRAGGNAAFAKAVQGSSKKGLARFSSEEAARWRAMVCPAAEPAPRKKEAMARKNSTVPPRWQPDEESTACSVCGSGFSVLKRRHHCRACGKLCCSKCAPANNTKPLPQFGHKQPVRHCARCYRSPFIDWTRVQVMEPTRRRTLGDVLKLSE